MPDNADWWPSSRTYYVNHTTGANTVLNLEFYTTTANTASIKQAVLGRWRVS